MGGEGVSVRTSGIMSSRLSEELVRAHERTVWRLALGYVRRFHCREWLLEDLVQEGMVALCRAWMTWRPAGASVEGRRLANFNTYAIFWMRSYMRQFLVANLSIVRPSKAHNTIPRGTWSVLMGQDTGLEDWQKRAVDKGARGADEVLIEEEVKNILHQATKFVGKSWKDRMLIEERVLSEEPKTIRELAERSGVKMSALAMRERRLREKIVRKTRRELR